VTVWRTPTVPTLLSRRNPWSSSAAGLEGLSAAITPPSASWMETVAAKRRAAAAATGRTISTFRISSTLAQFCGAWLISCSSRRPVPWTDVSMRPMVCSRK
jgi:hypothetical protein